VHFLIFSALFQISTLLSIVQLMKLFLTSQVMCCLRVVAHNA